MNTEKRPLWKTWWFWTLLILFILINLWVNRDQQDDPTPQLPAKEERIGTH